MTVKEYLSQARRLDQEIAFDIEQLRRLREMSVGYSPAQTGERVQSSRSNEAPFVRIVEQILEVEQRLEAKMAEMMALKEQILETIARLHDPDKEMVLKYRYIHGLTWEEIGKKLYADKSTIRRWHTNALERVVMPENPISLETLSRSKHI